MSLEPKRVYWRVHEGTGMGIACRSSKAAHEAARWLNDVSFVLFGTSPGRVYRVSVYDAKARREDLKRQIAEAVEAARRAERAKGNRKEAILYVLSASQSAITIAQLDAALQALGVEVKP